jgi:hypothetical protein
MKEKYIDIYLFSGEVMNEAVYAIAELSFKSYGVKHELIYF